MSNENSKLAKLFQNVQERMRCDLRKLFKSTLNNRLHSNLSCVIDKSSQGAKLKRAFEELPLQPPHLFFIL